MSSRLFTELPIFLTCRFPAIMKFSTCNLEQPPELPENKDLEVTDNLYRESLLWGQLLENYCVLLVVSQAP